MAGSGSALWAKHAAPPLAAHLAGTATGQAVPHKQRVQLAWGQAQRRVVGRLCRRRPLKPLLADGEKVLHLLQAEVQRVVVLEQDHACRQGGASTGVGEGQGSGRGDRGGHGAVASIVHAGRRVNGLHGP